MHDVTFVGIDPGLDGGIAMIYPDGNVDARVAPVASAAKSGKRVFDRGTMWAILRATTPAFAAIEKVSAAPMHGRQQGTTSMFSFGVGFGLWLGMLEALGIEYVEADPRRWKKAVLGGTKKDKAAATWYAQKVFPGVSLLATPRCRVPHDGIADALCLAEYARREHRVRATTS